MATCQADPLNYSTRAFTHAVTRRMMVKRACNPAGPGLRGLVTANVVRDARVPRGAVALATINAPPGTRMTKFRWAGSMRRRDCRYALQLWADAPDIQAIPIKNVRANRRCPRPARAQAAYDPPKTFDVPGATRIVQRVICVGADKRKWCSGRGLNYVRTYQATVVIADDIAPTVGILQDTPLAAGEWVSGTQPLNYTASDNAGVRSARALGRRTRDRIRQPRMRTRYANGTVHCSFALPKRPGTDRRREPISLRRARSSSPSRRSTQQATERSRPP